MPQGELLARFLQDGEEGTGGYDEDDLLFLVFARGMIAHQLREAVHKQLRESGAARASLAVVKIVCIRVWQLCARCLRRT